ncbi:SPFH domain-containing protein [Nocardia asteroides]|uniref:Stomatin family protein n=1 Tax=Nocardia asteroides NBRC 15531 TaxID=1110697 RepID=U5EDP8_NOCAS|nr:SPFH domain-containing protein [Nocardia asteroides]TLF64218.1 SPFH/Band 7/PHB domain protein [Nocardia asteroides NBRC 15531]UGT50680.1 SPFH/Band 7/PHB domain protein [Nocardia asteroides]SFN31034.1 SPFH domain, Band 7 family protein [Nocardia asteroides]VEG36493.1 FtsH protease regulator HflK [Nocardia asteroides]GAD83314.1 stomatin family protein [Nocardia asteroides NBRC 15531]
MVALIVAAVLVLLVVVVVFKSIALVPQAEAAVIERLGRYSRTVSGQLTFLVPFADRVRAKVDLRERVVSFPPQPVITQDNLTLQIDSVVYFQVTSPQAAVYEISNYIAAVEQLTVTTLRNVVGGMTLEETLTSRDQINNQLRGVLDEATGRWGLRVARVELKSIDPPPSIQESMEKQMKADREKRAMILTAEGTRESQIKTAEGAKQAQILSAEGAKQSAILSAEGERQSRILRAQGERAASYLQAQGQAKAIEKVFAAIKNGKPTPELLAYQYMQTLPMVARGDANKVWLVPSDFGKALEGFAQNFATKGEDGVFRYEPSPEPEQPVKIEDDSDVADWFETASDPKIEQAVRAAEATARTPVEGFEPPRPKTPPAPNPSLPSPPPVAPQPETAHPDDQLGRPWQPPQHG